MIQKVDYYFHHKVITLDYTCPNVYQLREEWETEIEEIKEKRQQKWETEIKEKCLGEENIKEKRFGEEWIWELVRHRAYRDKDGKIINTHPIGFIGGDNKGIDQLMNFPGDLNRVSNGTYPFSGLYKNVGPLGAAEQISKPFNHQKYFAAGDHRRAVPDGGYRRGKVVSFASPCRIEILPDAERVVKLVKTNAQARRDWAWLVLPIRWGYPATESPPLDKIERPDVGNISVVGPSYNADWNRSGGAPGFQVYSPYTFPSMFRVTWQDSFRNNLGFLNIFVLLSEMLPPSDAVWHAYRVGRYAYHSFRNTYKDYLIFKPNGPIPPRFMSWMTFAHAYMVMSPGFADLVLNPKELNAVDDRLANALIQGEGLLVEKPPFVENAHMLQVEVTLYLGERFATQSLLRFGNQ